MHAPSMDRTPPHLREQRPRQTNMGRCFCNFWNCGTWRFHIRGVHEDQLFPVIDLGLGMGMGTLIADLPRFAPHLHSVLLRPSLLGPARPHVCHCMYLLMTTALLRTTGGL